MPTPTVSRTFTEREESSFHACHKPADVNLTSNWANTLHSCALRSAVTHDTRIMTICEDLSPQPAATAWYHKPWKQLLCKQHSPVSIQPAAVQSKFHQHCCIPQMQIVCTRYITYALHDFVHYNCCVYVQWCSWLQLKAEALSVLLILCASCTRTMFTKHNRNVCVRHLLTSLRSKIYCKT